MFILDSVVCQANMQEIQTKVQEIQEKIQWIEDSLSGHTPIHEVFASSSPKKDLILQWAEYLEELAKLGVYQKPIFTISTHISKRLHELQLDTAIDRVRHILPFKYKNENKMREEDDDDNLRLSRPQISSQEEELYKENRKLIKLCVQTSDFYATVVEKLYKKHFLSKISKKEKKELDEFFLKWKNMLESAKDILDERNEVPHSKQFLFLYAKTLGTLGGTYSLFVKHLREFTTITPKQASKILSGRSSFLDSMYEPKNRLDAKNLGFYGFPCDYCNSWRTEYKVHPDNKEYLVHCFACGEWMLPKTQRLPKAN